MGEINWVTVIAALALAVTVINSLYTYYTQGQNATRKDITDQGKELDEQGKQIAAMKAQLATLPDLNAFHKMELAVVEIRGQLGVLSAETKPIAASAKRIEEFLMNQGPAGRTRK